MRGRFRRSLQLFVPVVITASLTCVASLYSQYLLDDEEYLRWVEGQKQNVPDNIALNIKAERVSLSSDKKCAVRITWDLKSEYTGEYVVARSDQVIDRSDKVKAARIIQTVNTSTSNTVMDNDCNPGNHYYVVLSSKSIMDDKIELVKDVNYTSIPVVIPPTDAPFRIAKIQAAGIGNARVRVAWERLDRSGMSFTVYRSVRMINSSSQLSGAVRLGAVADIGEFIDEGITESGTYFYAVTAKALGAPEDTLLVANENYTTLGVTVAIAKRPEPAPEPAKKERKVVKSGDVDRILKRTYFVNRYDEAIDELQDLIATTDNKEDAAKAKLFIGRSHIQLGQYRLALPYLVLTDVRKYFPEDADFWEEFALTRVRNY